MFRNSQLPALYLPCNTVTKTRLSTLDASFRFLSLLGELISFALLILCHLYQKDLDYSWAPPQTKEKPKSLHFNQAHRHDTQSGTLINSAFEMDLPDVLLNLSIAAATSELGFHQLTLLLGLPMYLVSPMYTGLHGHLLEYHLEPHTAGSKFLTQVTFSELKPNAESLYHFQLRVSGLLVLSPNRT